ncbi:MAG: LacI family DNA-binding transcriptional regulator [Oscillospiraceae bacterium]|jgi:LacI family transcriptional regulator|nr:LacI family DNA-binding transcriptional regulator [Oscillospiraceae bacterium]
MSRITLKMIAEKADTSIGTVDRALNNREGVSEGSKARVLQVAETLGYRPNRFASALGRKKLIRIGVAYPEEPMDFYRDIDRGFDKAIEELQDYGVVLEKIRYRTQAPAVARARLAQIDPANYDGLAINSAGGVSVLEIDRFAAAGIPVVTFNTDAPDSRRLFYVGNNSRQSGLMGGELLSMFLRGKGNVTVLGNFGQTTPFIERFGGFCEYVQLEAPGMQIYPCSECLSEPELAARNLTDLIARVPDINGVFCTGYSSTIGAVQTIKALNRHDIQIVGYDLTEQTAAALWDGWCGALLYQDPYRQGLQAVHLLVRHILEGWMPPRPRLHVDTQIILKTNLDSYMDPQREWLQSNLEQY